MARSLIDWLLVVRVKKPIFQGYFSIDFIQGNFIKSPKALFKVNKDLKLAQEFEST
ncbi:hypothetical protein H6G93_23130 [Nostoc sp. FACHB-973]|nr:hypothetical protein [Nostoc sp. FACHB-973]